MCRFFASFRQPYASELPSQMRMEEIPVRLTAMSRRIHHRRAAQDHLVDHELAVILADRSRGFRKARIRKIRRVRPFPTQSPIELVTRSLPFELRRESHAFPFGERGGLVPGNVTNGGVHF